MDTNNELDKYYALAEKWLNGTITEQEAEEFAEWYNSHQDKPVQVPVEFAENEEVLKQRIFKRIQNERKKPAILLVLYRRKFLQIAAVVFIVLCFSIGIRYSKTREGLQTALKQPIVPVKVNIVPAGNRAVLTLSDGSQIILDSAANGTLAKQGNTKIIKWNGRLTYITRGASNIVQYNTITTPKGGLYQVMIPDGTSVWLNAASSLKFPTAFTGKERTVELKGEAYFEVAKNKQMPFHVKVNDVDVTVLGTHFNVMAYDEESTINTTLLEGAVKVSKGSKETVIHPGQRASTNDQDGITVMPVDVDEAVAWKNGFFEFNGNIQGIMRQIARWYNVDIVYVGKVTDKAFGGAISRRENIADVLHMLELTGSIHFKIEGKNVMVMP